MIVVIGPESCTDSEPKSSLQRHERSALKGVTGFAREQTILINLIMIMNFSGMKSTILHTMTSVIMFNKVFQNI